MVNVNAFYRIEGWMINEFKGSELSCFAIIYSYSCGELGKFVGGFKNLAEMMKCGETTLSRALESLMTKELIQKEEITTATGRRVFYVTNEKKVNELRLKQLKIFEEGVLSKRKDGYFQNESMGTFKTKVYNEYSNKEIKEKKNMLSNDNNKSEDLFDLFWKKYKKGSKKKALNAWSKLKDKQKELALKNVDDYLIYCKRSGRPLKDVSTYLNGECFNDDWSAIPDCYQVNDLDDDRTKRFKRYMVSKFPDLIYHRNPLTYEQCDELFDEYGVGPFEEAMKRLCGRDIHQYYSIKSGVEHVLKEVQDDNI